MEHLEHGFWHWFTQSTKFQIPIARVEQYKGEEHLFLACTQLGSTAKYQTEVVNEWCDFLMNNKLPVKKIWVTTRISQKIFDAICHQKQLEGLWIKWGAYPTIQQIENLKNLEYLHLGGGASIADITSILKLKKLKSLETECLFNIQDYSFLPQLTNVIDLSIVGDSYASMKKINLKSLDFLASMPQLIRLNLNMTKIEDHSYLPALKINSLKYLTLPATDKDFLKDKQMFSKFKREALQS